MTTRSAARRPSAPVDHPREAPLEERLQTQHKLEFHSRYSKGWPAILVQARGHAFCIRDLWMIDAFAGRGLHPSREHPDGARRGTTLQAVVGARLAQQSHPGSVLHIRAIEKDAPTAAFLTELVAAHRGDPPLGLDVEVVPYSFAEAVPQVIEEILRSDHPHTTVGGRQHQHRSLWFIDPYGVDGVPHDLLATLPEGSEVIVNFDIAGLLRHVGNALKGDARATQILDAAYGSREPWLAAAQLPRGHRRDAALADAYAASLPLKYTKAYPLHASAGQKRFLVHGANTLRAIAPFELAYKAALKAGTVFSGNVMTTQQRARAAMRLAATFAGQTVTLDEMIAAGCGLRKRELRPVCAEAQEEGHGSWDPKAGVMEWFGERRFERQTLWRLSDGDDLT
jgi:three-Cys-motif partner protein